MSEAKQQYLQAAEQFKAETARFLDALEQIEGFTDKDVEFQFNVNESAFAEHKTFKLAELVQFLDNLFAGDKIPEFFHFDIITHAGLRAGAAQDTIEVTMPLGSHTDRTRATSWSLDASGSRHNGFPTIEPLASMEISRVIAQIKSDARKMIEFRYKDDYLPILAAAADVISDSLARTNITKLASEYMEERAAQKKVATTPAPNTRAGNVEEVIAAAKAKIRGE